MGKGKKLPVVIAPEPEDDVKAVIQYLKDCLSHDSQAMTRAFSESWPCNYQFAKKSLADCDEDIIATSGYKFGVLGVINGLLFMLGIPMIDVVWSEQSMSSGQRKIVDFVVDPDDQIEEEVKK